MYCSSTHVRQDDDGHVHDKEKHDTRQEPALVVLDSNVC
jgi:hypothetical protein